MAHSNDHSSASVQDIIDVIQPVPTGRLGVVLRQRRELAELEQHEAALLSGIDDDELCAIESGRHRPHAPTVARLLDAYGCPVQDLLPARRPLGREGFEGMSEADVLKHHLRQVQAWRKSERPQCFRADDLRVLVGILGTDGPTIEARLRALTGCTKKTAKWFRRLFVLGLAASAGGLLYQGSAAAASEGAVQLQMTPAAATAPMAAHTTASASVVCSALNGSPVPASSGFSHPAAVVKVSVAVMAYAGVQLDSAGIPVAVRTNTGNPPDCEASWYVFGPRHTSGEALENLTAINQVMDAVAGTASLPGPGKWQPGTWYQVQANGVPTSVHPANT